MNKASKKSKRLLAAYVTIILAVLVATTHFAKFRSSSVCTQCGEIQNSTEWQIPLTRITIFRQLSEQITPVSSVLVSKNIVLSHKHHWLFAYGNGNGIRCAIGKGRHLMRSVKSNGVADILAASHKFGELQFRDRLLQNLFDPTASEMVYGFCDGIPSDITGDAFAFRAWLAQAAEILDDVFTSGNKQ